ncbi:hypothetical protein BDB01DRAFT_728427 [Pilobolus umbonatus]|nr:hypothetical protein BDB01DRAFT_728427 [Pilobolus umbonatus]
MATENKKALVYSILEFLQKSCEDGTITEDDSEGIEVAMQCIGEAFGVDINNDTQKQAYSTKPATLLSIFDVYLRTKKNSAKVFYHLLILLTSVSAEDKQQAESKKAMGNRKVAERNYPEAIKLYTEAIELDGNNAVYYANRAAAYSQQSDHEKAVADAKKATEIDPKYSKAYSRMGHAYFCLNKYSEAVDAYEKALELDPNNVTVQNSLATAKSKISSSSSVDRSVDTPPTGGLPNLGGAGGGMPDLGSLLNNPNIMNMAQQMMQSGALDNLMSNPDVARMAQQMMGGGGVPNLQDMMSNPDMMRM